MMECDCLDWRRDVAAIASERAGALYGLHVLARSMEGPLPTVCRFILLARDPLITSARACRSPSLALSCMHARMQFISCCRCLGPGERRMHNAPATVVATAEAASC